MNFKRYNESDNSWTDSHYIMGTDTDTLTALPAVIYPNDTSITVGIKGQSSQSGTPSPSNPVPVNGTGERTGNLFNKDKQAGNIYVTETITRYGVEIPVSAGTYSIVGGTNRLFVKEKYGTTYGTPIDTSSQRIITLPQNGYIIVYAGAEKDYTVSSIMLNAGSTPLPYEPYGIKIPILIGGNTINKYLGEVQTVRQIKKLVLTGEENWAATTGGYYLADLPENYLRGQDINYALCSHNPTYPQVQTMAGVPEGYVSFSYDTLPRLYFKTSDIASLSDFKTYLAQQYANGTPVCVWYVLATATTGTVNEPLMKIGTYADSLTTSIPCTAGENTLDVQTTVQPSEVTAGFNGWHNASEIVHRYQYGEWDGSPPPANPWEQFRDLVRSGEAQSLYPVGTKLYENWGDETSNAWIVVDYPTGEDYLDSDLAQQGYINRVMLMEEKLNYLRQFDAIEAWLYVETAIPTGTYRFTIPNYDTSYGGNKTYIFTSTADVPVGGQLTLTWAYNTNPTKVQGFSSSTSTSALFDVTIAEWDGTTACTDLGTIKLAIADADSTYGKLNHIHRARYGSNNYYQSGLRQWLNTNASANWWTPSNIFDRPYDNRINAGRLNVMNSNMKSVLATPTVNCITNNLFEYPSLDGTTFSLQTAYTVKDKLFLVTHTETNLSSTPNVDSVLAYYTNAQSADRIKYRKDNGNAYYWWLRTPTPTTANHVRTVNTSGALNNFGAYNTFGSAAACIIQ